MINLKRLKTKEELEKGIESLTSIFIEEYPYYSTWISKCMEQFVSGEKQILSVEKDDKTVGYLMLHFSTSKIVKINGIYIFEEFKGQGIASQAILKLVKILTQSSVDLIYVQTRLDNNAVVHLFDKTNFELIGTNFHEIEQKNNWVACNKINPLITQEQEIATNIYDGFTALNKGEILSLRKEHKNGNLILRKTKKEGNKNE